MGSKKKNAQKGKEKSTGQPNGQQKTTSSPKSLRVTDASPKTSKGRASKASANKADRKRPVQSSSLLFSKTSFIILSVIVVGAAVHFNNDARSAVGDIFIQYINPQVLKVAEFLSLDTSGYVRWVEDTLIIGTENLETLHSLSTEPPSQPGKNEDYDKEASEQGETATAEEAAASVDNKSEEESKAVREQESHQEQQEPLESKDGFEASGKQVSVEKIVMPPENAHLALKEEETEERIQKPEVEEVRVKTTPKVNVDRPQSIDGHEETKTETEKIEIREDDAVDGKKAVAEEKPPISQPEIFAEKDEMIKEARELEVSEPQEQVIPNMQQEKENSVPTQAQKRLEPSQEQEKSAPAHEQKRSFPAQEQERSRPVQEPERLELPQKHELPQEQTKSEPAQQQETSQPAQRTQVDLGSMNKPESPQRRVKESETENKAQQNNEALERVNAQVSPTHGEDSRETEKSKKKKDLAQSRKEYAKSSVTSDADFKIRKKLDKADELLANNKLDEALAAYDEILHKHSSSPRALLGKADTLDKMAEQKRSNEFLEQSIMVYDHLVSSRTEVTIPTELLKQAGLRLANRQQFRGLYNWASF